MSEVLNISSLTRGDYTIGVKCRYFRIINNKKVYYWTEPVYKSFTIAPYTAGSPVNEIYGTMDKRLNDSPYFYSIIVFLFAMAVIYKGYRAKIVFYMKLFNYKRRYYFADNLD
jgi:hypothetical protein